MATVSDGKPFGNPVQGRGDDRLTAGEGFEHYSWEGFGAHLRMDQAVYRVHSGGDVLAIRGQPGPFPEAEPRHVCFQNLLHISAAYDQDPRLGKLLMNLRRRLQEFALTFAARQVVAADGGEHKVLRRQSPFVALRRRVKRPKAVRINSIVENVNF